jgi:F-type H+-transporting ATPase subunit gamma
MTMDFLDGLLQRVLATTPALEHPLCRSNGTAESLLVVCTSDTGLCGSYNGNLIQLAEAHLRRDSAAKTQLVFIGKKGHRYFTKRGWRAEEAFLDLAGRPDLKKIEAIGRSLMARFLSGRVGSVSLLYSRFVSATTYRPTIQPWLPIQLPVTSYQLPVSDYIFEPTPQRVFDDLLPRWALAAFQRLMLEAMTSEHSARMLAMKSATDNAQKVIEELTRLRNKIRQASITKELSEIVGTAEALK